MFVNIAKNLLSEIETDELTTVVRTIDIVKEH